MDIIIKVINQSNHGGSYMKTDSSKILVLEDLVKYYGSGESLVRAVDHTSLEIERGKFTAIVGHSGSGMSTLLHLIG